MKCLVSTQHRFCTADHDERDPTPGDEGYDTEVLWARLHEAVAGRHVPGSNQRSGGQKANTVSFPI